MSELMANPTGLILAVATSLSLSLLVADLDGLKVTFGELFVNDASPHAG